MSKLIVISAPSGAGKTTLCAQLLKEIPTLVLSISCTTRAPRGNEKHGHEYFFLTLEDFQAKIQSQAFAEWAEVHGNYYGTLKATIEENLSKGKSVLLDIDVQGADLLRKSFSGRVATIFISPPNLEELERRLRARGTDSEESIQKRLKNAAREMKEAQRFDLVLVNDSFDHAYTQLKQFVTKALHG
jgi:guanylate kinase